MASYTSVAVESDVTHGKQQQKKQQQQQQQVQSVAEVSFSGEGGAPRSEWWWGAGPVDSCCCCCSLPTGMLLLATNDFLNGIWMIFFMESVRIKQLKTALVQAQEVYRRSCTGYAASGSQCQDLKEAMEQAEDDINVLRHLPFIYYVQGVTCILAGALGIWAVHYKSPRSAKVYMLSWPVKFLLGLWTTVDMVASMKNYGVESHGHVVPMLLLNAFFLLYFFKVSWSYYKRLDHKGSPTTTTTTTTSGGGGGSSAPSGIEDPAIAMLTMNSSV